MKKILILLAMFYQLIANENININLTKFADLVSKQNNLNIMIDETLNKNISLLIPTKMTNKDLFTMFKMTINKEGFNLKRFGKTYYLTKKLRYLDKSYIYNLKYDSFKDCEAILTNLGVSYTYLKGLNAFIIKSTRNEYLKIKTFLDKTDIKHKQVTLKLTIFEIGDDISRERGIQYGSIYRGIDGSIQTAINTIIAPISTNNPIMGTSNFYAALRLLNEDKEIELKQHPFILAKHNKSFKFEAVENIPYLISTTTTQATNTSEQNTIEYKDVGLKINGKAFIHESYITLDLDLVIEDLLTSTSSENVLPETYKRILKSNTDIEYNKVLLLSGLKRTKTTDDVYSLPWISDIPYLGELFKYTSHSVKHINTTIAIEVIKKGIYEETSLDPEILENEDSEIITTEKEDHSKLIIIEE